MFKQLLAYLVCFYCFCPALSFAQLFKSKNYPQNYFSWPVGTKVGIVANFGELRPNHYHMGLDCRTDGQVNVPILAAADGYIAKIHVDATGFGRCLYINHPNGLTTVYAHLNKMAPNIEAYLNEQQYKQKKWKIDVEPSPSLLKVKKGDFIAYSGNTGGSQGPHLHFEIRDTKTDKVLNPLQFGFPIPDNIPPDVLRLSVYDRRKSTYEQVPKIYTLKKINGVYKPLNGNITINFDKVSFAITAYDRYTGSTNQNGIFGAAVYLDNKFVSGFEMDSISYDETRYLNAHIDYKTREQGGPYLQHLSPLPGYTEGIYQTANNKDGIINLNDNNSHQIRIDVLDANYNKSAIAFELTKPNYTPNIYTETSDKYYFKPLQINVFDEGSFSFYLPEKAIYDSFHLKVTGNTTEKMFSMLNTFVPVQQYFPVRIKGDYPITDSGKIIMKQWANRKEKYKKAFCEKGWYRSDWRDFGTYQLIKDITAPTLMPIGSFKDGCRLGASRLIMFKATDNTKVIASFTGLLDGQWLLFSNDKEGAFVYEIDKYCPPGEHSLTIIVTDLAGNKTEKQFRFTR